MKQIELTQGKVTLVDDALYEYLTRWKWRAQKSLNTFYAVRRPNIQMHRVIAERVGISIEGQIDHEDGDGLNNQSYNLRAATYQQNGANRGPQANNTSGFKGVFWDNRWRARIQVNGKDKHLGSFDTAFEAAIAYDAAAKEALGEFAFSNERYIAERLSSD